MAEHETSPYGTPHDYAPHDTTAASTPDPGSEAMTSTDTHLDTDAARADGPARRGRRGPDPLSLLVGLATLVMAVFAFVGELPDLSFVDPRWVLAGGAAAVGLFLLVGNLRGRRGG